MSALTSTVTSDNNDNITNNDNNKGDQDWRGVGRPQLAIRRNCRVFLFHINWSWSGVKVNVKMAEVLKISDGIIDTEGE